MDKHPADTPPVHRPLVAVLGDGLSARLCHCLRRSTAWEVVELGEATAPPGGSELNLLLVSGVGAAAGLPPHLRDLPLLVLRRGLEECEAPGARGGTLSDPVEISLRRLLGDELTEAASRLVVVEWRPAEQPLGRRGPLDAARIAPGATLRLGGGRPASIVHQVFVAPHTRARLVTCTALGAHCPTAPQFLERAASAPFVFVASPADGFGDTAAVSEYFRDLGNGLGFFYETVLFAETVQAWDGGITFTFACDDMAVVPELIGRLSTPAGPARPTTRG